jgi:membrane fusion protein (multidrug efflux system)
VNVKVEVVRALPALADTITLPGVTEPNRVVKVPAEVREGIKRIACEEGRPCRAGDELILLDTDRLQAECDKTKESAEFAQREYERLTKLHGRGVSSPAELDRVRTQAAVSKAAYDIAKADLDRATIRAPIGGILNRVLVEKGEFVNPGDVVAEIVDVDTVKVVLDVPERDVHFLEVGASEEVFVKATDGEHKVTGKIGYISELADASSRTSRVEIFVDNKPVPEPRPSAPGGGPAGASTTAPAPASAPAAPGKRPLRSGQIVRVRLTRRVLQGVIMVPLAAVIPLEEGYVVYVAQDGKAARREVQLGFIKGRSVRVLSGLAEGDRLIVSGHRYVGPGDPVAVQEQKDAKPASAGQAAGR